MTTAGVMTEYPIPTLSSGAYCIVAGPDGALWFTESISNKIGRITTAGAITEYAIPTTGSTPLGITAGPDGALWFVERRGNKIGQITTSGTITEYAIPTAGSSPVGITAGADGALWFTESSGDQIGRITTAGAITQYPIPTKGSGSWSITAGPDGALWFAEQYVDKIGRIATTGDIAEYAGLTKGSAPWGIRSGPDGALWFTERKGNQIGRITTAGAVSEYAIPAFSGDLFGIGVGPDGALWITDDGRNSVIRAAILAQAPPLAIFNNPPLSAGSVGVNYSQTLSATGGAPPYTWVVSAGSLPAGLTLDSNTGQITGTPAASGAANFTVQVMDATGATAAKAFGLTIAANPIVQYPLPLTYRFGGITKGPDGALWFTERTSGDVTDQIGRITTSGAITEYPLPGCDCSGPNGITTGPDGALWFGYGFVVGRITTAGDLTEYPVPNAGNIDGIAAGPDGALWFTDSSFDYIGRITTAGAITQYPVTTHGPNGDSIQAITAGPDGALWFTEAAGYIDRITTAGTITYFPVRAAPTAIAAGPDGALWFTDSNGAIGRITTAGVATEYPIPTPLSYPAGITLGPDGALWFTEYDANNIGRITVSGAITEYPIPSADAGYPGAITSGPDGALWFTEDGGEGGGAIGRFLPAPVLTSINPASGAQGATVPVVLTGSSFVSGGTTVNVPAGITLSNLNVVSPAELAVTFAIASNMATGPVDITVSTAGGTSQPVTFTITPPAPPPSLTSISPASGVQGTSVPVVLTGANFIAGPTIAATNFPNDYNQLVPFTGTPTLVDNGQLTVTATVYPDPTDPNSQWVDYSFQSVAGGPLAANPDGFWQVYLTNIPLMVPGTFTGIQYYWTTNGTAAPNITAIEGLKPVVPNLINPALGLVYGSTFQGGAPLSLFDVFVNLGDYAAALQAGSMNAGAINGFHLAARTTGGTFAGVTVTVANPGVTVSNVSLISATQIAAVLNIAANAALGPANVTVSNPIGTSTPPPAVTFTVLSLTPTLTSISPSAGTVGTSINVLLNGSNFVPGGTTVSVTGGVTTSNVIVTGGNQLTATLNIPAAATPGQVNVTVTTAGGTAGPVGFTINPAPQFTTASPLPSGTVGTAYLQGVSVSGGTPPYTWLLTAGSLPAGLSLDPATCSGQTAATACLIVGTPNTNGTSNFTLKVTDGSGATVSGAFALTIGPLAPTITSIAPPAGAQGTQVPVVISGANFVPGATVSMSNPGVTAANVVVTSASRITATFTIAGDAAPGPENVLVTTSGGTSLPAVFTVLPPAPVLTSINPSAGSQGTSVPVTLTGNNFVAGATIAIGASGVTASQVTVVSPTQITATFVIAGNAAVGPAKVTVTTSSGASGSVTFTVTSLLLTSINPATGAPGASVPVTLTGAGFVAGAQVVSSSPDVTASNVLVVSATQITATLKVAATAAPGPVSISVTAGGVTSAPVTFTVGSSALLTLTSISPNLGTQGSSLPVTLTGTGFVTGDQITVGNSGVTVGSIAVVSPTQITATFVIAGNAAVGPAKVTVTTSSGASGSVTFTVTSLLLTSINPTTGAPGASVPVTLTGAGFVAGAQVVSSSPDVTASNVVVVSATQITATLKVAATAASGPVSISVTAGGITSAPVTFTVGSPALLTLTSISPNLGAPGASVPVTLTGAGFAQGAQVSVSNPGVTAGGVVVVSSTQITATFNINATAALGPTDVKVAVGGVTSAPVTFTVGSPALLTLTSISPNLGTQGSSVSVTLTGTGFVTGDQITVGNSGVTVGSIVVVSPTQITATFNIAANAPLGAANVAVSASGGSSGQVTFTVSPPPPTLTSISVVSAPQGSSVAITLTGTSFTSGASITVANPGVTVSSVAVVSPTTITATLTIAADAPVGAATVKVSTPGGASGTVTFTIAPAIVFTITGLPSSISSGQQISFTVSIAQAYAEDISGVLTVQFTPGQSLPPDPTLALLGGTCVAGKCTVDFQIPASQTSAAFSLQTGTVAGSLEFSINNVAVGGAVVTLSNNPPTTASVPAQPPSITGVSIQPGSSGFNIVVTGFANTREITEADFTFTPASGDQIQTATFSLTNVAATFQTYYATDASVAVGSQFVYTQPFNVTAGSIGTLKSVTVTLKNSTGASSTVSANF